MAMTIEQLKHWARNQVILDDVTEREREEAIAAIDALTQPAQAVDVGTGTRKEKLAYDRGYQAGRKAERTRALAGEKAGPVGDGPDVALLASMATCLHHGFGLLDATQQQPLLHDMRKLWDEVMGRGYYRPENRDRYLAYLASPTPDKEGA